MAILTIIFDILVAKFTNKDKLLQKSIQTKLLQPFYDCL